MLILFFFCTVCSVSFEILIFVSSFVWTICSPWNSAQFVPLWLFRISYILCATPVSVHWPIIALTVSFLSVKIFSLALRLFCAHYAVVFATVFRFCGLIKGVFFHHYRTEFCVVSQVLLFLLCCCLGNSDTRFKNQITI